MGCALIALCLALEPLSPGVWLYASAAALQRPLFALTFSRSQGLHVCDVIDIFADWQQKSGSRDMQLLMLALLDKEQEMPGVWGFK